MRGVVLVLVVLMTACSDPGPEPCTDAWYAQLETRLGTGDGRGHGPDIGSEEWMSVIEFKLGVRGRAEVPPLGTPDWCLYIDEQVF